ncbi:MAG TPA: AAA family ATPase, partial [Actinomycetota bacterium]|nr:AAA family ATPase [Actinomycetota bacterium]
MAKLPTGTVTFLFTDIEGSTGLLQELGPDRYQRLQDEHDAIVRAAIAEGDGTVVRTEGDAFFAAFPTPAGALRAAVGAQRGLAAAQVRVRMGLHTGEGRLGGGDYVGLDVHRAARIAAAGHGGQILLSAATRSLVEHDLPAGVAVRDLGPHHLKDIEHPERLFDLVVEGLPSDFPPPAARDARPNNLPERLTSFVGRRKEIDETIRLLSEHRLVTLTGPGGTGKTRLALEVAATLLSSFDDGAFLVDLAPLTEPNQVCPAICEALGVHEEAGRDLVEMLVDRLAGRSMLLLLDNFEHLLAEAPLVGDVLARVPEPKFLVTSRTPLGLYGEQEQPVPPLTVPEDRTGPDLDALVRYEAVALFVDRARAASPGFALTAENASAVADICARLDGLPLALELAASRIKVLTPDAIRSHLEGGLDLLAARATNVPERQRTLRATIAWSESLLDEPERRMFARLSVFAGGADLDAVAAVADERMDVLERLTTLVDHSLVVRIDADEPRFGMLETIREFARERLEAAGTLDATRRRHAEHFLGLAEAAEPYLTSDDQVPWLDRLDRDHENVQAALGWAMEAGQIDRALGAAASLWRFWLLRAHITLGRAWLERLLAIPGGPSSDRARAHNAAGSLAYWLQDVPDTERHYGSALEMFEGLGDRRGIAEAKYNLAWVPYVRGSGYEEALVSLREAAEVFEQLGDEESAARARGDISYFMMLAGDHTSALPLLEQSVDRARNGGDVFSLVDNLVRLAETHRAMGDHGAARAACLEALEVLERGSISGGIAAVLQLMAASEEAEGRHERAMRLHGAAEAMAEELGAAQLPPLAEDPVGPAREAMGD